ncbi:MAG: hypothetical protein M0Z43_09820 [Acidithiobacillus sp.]|nr:hypothetical protein [Acidithiobacillus sp.]
MDFAQHCGEGFGANWRGILFRQSYPQLADVVAKSKKWFYQIFPKARFNEASYTWKWPDGEELLLRHMKSPDDYWNYHGHEYPWIGWEELTNWPDLVCYDKMKACSRSSHPGMPRKYRSTCNPYGVGHGVVKMRFIDPAPALQLIEDNLGKRVRIHGDVEENRILLAADPEYIGKLDAIDDENLRKAWRFGDWDIVAGGIFTEVWEPTKHILEPFDIPKTWRVDRSFDWGSSKPFSIGWWAESDGSEVMLKDGTKRNFPRGTLFRINEWYGWNGKPNEGLKMLAADVAKGIKERESNMGLTVRPGPADNSIFDTQDGHCIADNMAAQGVRWERCDKSPGSRTNGWELVRGRLAASKKHPMEEPGLFVFNICRQWLRTVPTMPRDEKKMDDVDSDAEDHCFSADTQILTSNGTRRISDIIGTTGKVLTADGLWANYKDCRLTRNEADTVTVYFSDGSNVKCTPDHLFMTKKGWQKALYLSDETCYSVYNISARSLQWSHEKLARQSKNLTGSIITSAGHILGARAYCCTGWFLSTTTALFQGVCTYITKIKTGATTVLKTLTYSTSQHTRLCTQAAGMTTNSPIQRGSVPPSGTDQSRGRNGIVSRAQKMEPSCHPNSCSASIAGNQWQSRQQIGHNSDIVLKTANQPQGGKAGSITLKGLVLTAIKSLESINIGQRRHAAGNAGPLGENKKVLRVEAGNPADVYCLSVPGYNAFALANGIMVKNCGDETRYRVSMPRRTATQGSASMR